MSNLQVAVALHLFYDETWPEIRAHLENIDQDFSLFVTIPELSVAENTVLRDFPKARIVRVPNVGRDVAPFIRLLPDLQHYDVVCKIHSKRSVGTDGSWRAELLRGVLGSTRLVALILQAYSSRSDLALVGSELLYLDGPRHTFGTRPLLEKYHGALPSRFGFFGGTMFWTRPQLFADFPRIFPQSDFVEHGETDHHPEHACERLFGIRAAMTAGAQIGLAGETFLGRPRIKIRPAAEGGQMSMEKAMRKMRKRR